jgi:hypothetical protein
MARGENKLILRDYNRWVKYGGKTARSMRFVSA